MQQSNLVRQARSYLLSFSAVDNSLLDRHIHNWKELRRDSIADVYRTALHHAQNRQGMPNSIGDIDRLRAVFKDFEPREVVNYYSEPREILEEILAKDIRISGRMNPDNPKSHWMVFATAAISMAHFLSRFSDARAFHTFVESFYLNEYSRLALPLLLKEEIFGFGFALACDFLKESGYEGFVKPDTHLNAICRARGVTKAKSDVGVFRDVITFCAENKLVPYEFDKLIWLVGSGNFYLANLRVNTNRNDFIKNWL